MYKKPLRNQVLKKGDFHKKSRVLGEYSFWSQVPYKKVCSDRHIYVMTHFSVQICQVRSLENYPSKVVALNDWTVYSKPLGPWGR